MVRARKSPPDGRANNGGVRQGTPGQNYGNRSDLRTPKQPVSVPPSAEYGQGERLRRAQQSVPMAGAPPVPQPGGATGQPRPWATPEDTPRLTDPTTRPNEPLEAGMPFGPGPGPAVSAQPMSDTEARLRALYAAYPTQQLRDLIRQIDLGG